MRPFANQSRDREGAGIWSLAPLCLATMLLAGAAIAQQRQQDIDLQAAMRTATVDGDLGKAIKQYAAIVTKYKNDRAVTAMALVHMAEAYQKMGDAESRKIYEQVVREYGDQKEAVAVARAKLGAGGSNSVAATRQLWTGSKVDAYGTVSPDGRFLSFTDWDTGDLALHDFTTGLDRRLTNKGTWEQSPAFALLSAISRDGKQVAYEWLTQFPDYLFELRVIDINGGKPRVLVANTPGVEVLPLDWSPDGKWIAVRLLRAAKRQAQIGLVSTADGTIRVLKSADWQGGSKLVFSPDGEYLACDVGTNERWEIHLLAVDSSGETPVLTEPFDDWVLGWSPDGKRLLFASERSGLSGIWAIAIAGGKPHGAPALVKANVSPNSLGMTRSGALYYSVAASGRDLYLASVDLAADRLLSTPRPVARPYLGLSDYPQWSRDGRHLAYFSKRNANNRSIIMDTLAILSVETGKTRELRTGLRQFSFDRTSPMWSPDDSSLLVNGMDQQGRAGAYRIDVQTGDATAVLVGEPGQPGVSARAWSPDGKTLYLFRTATDRGSRTETLLAHDLASGQEREILRREGPRTYATFGWIALSPDGQRLVATVFDKSNESGSLLVIPAQGGATNELFRSSNSSPEQLGAWVEWSPDGKFVIFRKGARPATRETFRIPAEGGAAVRYGAEWTPGPHSISPDGRQVVFSMGEHKIEVWTMENFLAAIK